MHISQAPPRAWRRRPLRRPCRERRRAEAGADVGAGPRALLSGRSARGRRRRSDAACAAQGASREGRADQRHRPGRRPARASRSAGSRLDLWQANRVGRYDHPGDHANPAALDPNFQGFARLVTDRDGQFKFRTIKPSAYDTPIGMRTPHIHFDIHGRSERLVTQMYFPGEALNERRLPAARTPSSRESVIAEAIDAACRATRRRRHSAGPSSSPTAEPARSARPS